MSKNALIIATISVVVVLIILTAVLYQRADVDVTTSDAAAPNTCGFNDCTTTCGGAGPVFDNCEPGSVAEYDATGTAQVCANDSSTFCYTGSCSCTPQDQVLPKAPAAVSGIPGCLLDSNDPRTTIVNFLPYTPIVSNGTPSESATVGVSLDFGAYDVQLQSYDDHLQSPTSYQPHEQFHVELFDGITWRPTFEIPDLPPNVNTLVRYVNGGDSGKLPFPVSNGITISSAKAVHHYPNDPNTNSIVPICASFTRLDDRTINATSCQGMAWNPPADGLYYAPGETFDASVVYRNDGVNTWNASTGHALGSSELRDNIRWANGVLQNRVPLYDSPNNFATNPDPVGPGFNATFDFTSAVPVDPASDPQCSESPAGPGIYTCPFAWEMVQDGVGWLDHSSICRTDLEINTNEIIISTDNAGVCNAIAASHDDQNGTPIDPNNPLVPGESLIGYVKFTNTGTKQWDDIEPDPHRLGESGPNGPTIWNVGRVVLLGGNNFANPANTIPIVAGTSNDTAVFNFLATTPDADTVAQNCAPVSGLAGRYNCQFEWLMVEENVGWFGNPICALPLQVQIPETVTPPPTPTPTPIGAHEAVTNCTVSTGWTCDESSFSSPVPVHFYLDSQDPANFLAEVYATETREQGIADQCGGNAEHGFTYILPESVKDGQPHQLLAYAIDLNETGAAQVPSAGNPLLTGSPIDFTCQPPPEPPPAGNHTSATCDAIAGWACDDEDFSAPLTMHVYADGGPGVGTLVATPLADQDGGATVATACGGNANHSFTLSTPESLKDGQAHDIYVFALNLNPAGPHPLISGSPKSITCTPPVTELTCSPATQTVNVDQTATITAVGGQGSTSYSWSALGGNPSTQDQGGSFSTAYSSAGTKTVTVTSGALSDTCEIIVNATPTPTPTATPAPSTPRVVTDVQCDSTPSATFSWSGSPDTDSGLFTVELDTDSSFSNPFVITTSSKNATDSQFPGFTMRINTTYYIRVFNGKYSGSSSFSVNAVPTCVPETETPTPPPSNFEMSIQKLGRNITDGQSGEFTSLSANPGDIIEFVVRLRSLSNTTLTNVFVRDVLPPNTTYVANSLKIDGSTGPEGLASGGIFIGDIPAGAQIAITFRAQIGLDSQFPTGTTNLLNKAIADSNETNPIEDDLPITVFKGEIEVPVVGVGTVAVSIGFALFVAIAIYLVTSTGILEPAVTASATVVPDPSKGNRSSRHSLIIVALVLVIAAIILFILQAMRNSGGVDETGVSGNMNFASQISKSSRSL